MPDIKSRLKEGFPKENIPEDAIRNITIQLYHRKNMSVTEPIPVDDDLKCIMGRIFTIAGREWPNAPKEMWKIDDVTKKPVAPKTYSVALRLDLEAKATSAPGPEGTAPDLMTF